ncbi:alpha/beta hydrolase family esterase [Nocardia macrotermitis]|uniref:Polyhydroxybutyrate depolymerase n=1 Tax=Nocardia macrotermitis TaxID=2585198 RepID=A0A7K0CZ77_9NOCA|nr:hypothetical protein [Nocardia macrotermitis]MQY18761.1 hypothetical protein [Nocardia macrotermitis]
MFENAAASWSTRQGAAVHRTALRVGRAARALLAATALAATTLTAAGQVAEAAPANSVAAVGSSGCHLPAVTSGQSTRHFSAAGRSGTYIQDVPPGTSHPLPLVFDLHGYLELAVLEHEGSGLGPYGDSHGFVTITPQIDEPGWPRWDFSPASADVSYLSQLMSHIEATSCIDLRRVYVAGLSMGAFTTSSLACQLSDRIAAVAPVAGLQNFSWCRTQRPVPVIAFHGTADPLVAYGGGQGANARYLPSPDGGSSSGPQNGPGPTDIPANAAAWAHRNGCPGKPQQRKVTADVVVTSFDCPANATVELYSVLGGGHTWPGHASIVSPTPLVGSTTTSIDATATMWDFFQAHPLTGPVHG